MPTEEGWEQVLALAAHHAERGAKVSNLLSNMLALIQPDILPLGKRSSAGDGGHMGWKLTFWLHKKHTRVWGAEIEERVSNAFGFDGGVDLEENRNTIKMVVIKNSLFPPPQKPNVKVIAK